MIWLQKKELPFSAGHMPQEIVVLLHQLNLLNVKQKQRRGEQTSRVFLVFIPAKAGARCTADMPTHYINLCAKPLTNAARAINDNVKVKDV